MDAIDIGSNICCCRDRKINSCGARNTSNRILVKKKSNAAQFVIIGYNN